MRVVTEQRSAEDRRTTLAARGNALIDERVPAAVV